MFNLDAFIESCKSAVSNNDPASKVKALVRDAIAHPEGLNVSFRERVTGKALRDRIVYQDDKLTVLQVATVPGLRSPVHDHNMWAVIGVYEGEEHNTFFEETADGLRQVGEQHLKEGDIAVLPTETIHAIKNPTDQKSNAIHIYGGNLITRQGRNMWNPFTQKREAYEIGQLSEYTKELSGID